jgi:hypothetical protein
MENLTLSTTVRYRRTGAFRVAVTDHFTYCLLFFTDELYNNIGDIQDYFLEQNEVLNNQLAYNKQRMVEDNE